MSDTPGTYNVTTLKSILDADQQNEAERDRDRAIVKCAAFTAAHYTFLAARGLPDHLVERLTVEFQEAYLQALYAPSYSFLMDGEDDDL